MTDLFVRTGGGASNSAATYSLSDGGGADGSVPVSGDTLYCTALSGNLVWTGSQSFDNLICTGYTGTMSGTGTPTILGDTLLLVAGMTYTATGLTTFTGANAVGDVTISRAGKATNQTYILNGVGKVFKLGDAPSMGTGGFTLTNGTLDSQGFDITCSSIAAANTNTRSIIMTGSDLFLTGTINILGAGLTLSPPDRILFTRGASNPTTAIITCNTGDAFPLVEISQAVTGAFSGFQLLSNADIGELAFVGAASSSWLGAKITLASDTTVDKCTFPAGTELVSSANGTQRTITTGTNEISFDGCMIRDIVISGGPAIATNSIDLGNNSGITFQNFGANTHQIVGVTYDDAGDPLPSCTVIAFKEDGGEMKEVSRATSDGTTGAYILPTPDNDPTYLIVATNTGPKADAMSGITPTAP